MPRKIIIIALLASLLLGITLACNLLSNMQGDLGEARGTAAAIATEARGFVTQVEGLATEVDARSALATLESFVTQEGPEAEATLKALGTKAAESNIYETAQAFVTQEGPDLLATVQAIATQGLQPNDPPDDIPLVAQSNLKYLYATQSTVSYQTDLDYQTVLEFYKQEMPANGWEFDSQGSVETGNAAVLRYEKIDRTANVALGSVSPGQTTTVLITIFPK
jgi:hypothetical protein